MDPDLPIIRVDQQLIEKVKNEQFVRVPFDQKIEMCDKYGLSIVDVQTVFLHGETIEVFENLIAEANRPPKEVFNWMYVNLFGNVNKKDLDFHQIVTENFKNGQILGQLIDLVETEKKLS